MTQEQAVPLTAEQWWYVLSVRYRKAIGAAIGILEHTSDHHATDARLTLIAARDSEGNDPKFPEPLSAYKAGRDGLSVNAVDQLVAAKDSVDAAYTRLDRRWAHAANLLGVAPDIDLDEFLAIKAGRDGLDVAARDLLFALDGLGPMSIATARKRLRALLAPSDTPKEPT